MASAVFRCIASAGPVFSNRGGFRPGGLSGRVLPGPDRGRTVSGRGAGRVSDIAKIPVPGNLQGRIPIAPQRGVVYVAVYVVNASG